MNINYEMLKSKIIDSIKADLKFAWINARKPDIESELRDIDSGLRCTRDNAFREQKLQYETTMRNRMSYIKISSPEEIERESTRLYNSQKMDVYNQTTRRYESKDRESKEQIINKVRNKAEQDYKVQIEYIQADCRRENTRKIDNIQSQYDSRLAEERAIITKKYENEFVTNWNTAYLHQFQAQFYKFEPDTLQTKLLQRHKWLGSEQTYNYCETLLEKFLTDVIKLQFWECLAGKRSHAGWRTCDLKFQKLSWNEIDDTWLQQYIQSYPLRGHDYRTRLTFDTWFYYKNGGEFRLAEGLLTRTDLYNVSYKFGGFNPRNCDGELRSVSIVPMHIDELKTLSNQEKAYIEYLFINIASEGQPLWILLHKQSLQYTLYLPNLEVKFNKRLLDVFSKHIIEVRVDLSLHRLMNEENAPDETIWHAALLTRVFSWLRDTSLSKKTLAEYRKDLPVLLLVEGALSKIGGYEITLSNAFANRAPFSKYSYDEYYREAIYNRLPALETKQHLIEDWSVLTSTFSIHMALSSFDNSELILGKSQPNYYDTVSVNTDKPNLLFYALKLSEHHYLPKLVVSDNLEVARLLQDKSSWQYKMVGTNFSLMTLLPASEASNLSTHKYLFTCAARNRLLKFINPKSINSSTDMVATRKKLWEITGQVIGELFKADKFSDLEIAEIIEFNSSWRTQFCPDEFRPNNYTNRIWPFLQLAQIGCEALDVFFKYLETTYVNSWDGIHEKDAPALNCTFDLQGSLVETPIEYIRKLRDKINKFGFKAPNSYINCAPLFKSLALIMPRELSAEIIEGIINLFKELSQRHSRYPNDICEVEIHNLDIASPETPRLLQALQKIADDLNTRLQVSIRVPKWDKQGYTQDNRLGSIKSNYRHLQNTIENNLRYARYEELRRNTSPLKSYIDGRFNPDLQLENHEAQYAQAWDGEDVEYPLTSESPGIQQQLQQNVAVNQEYQQAVKLEAVKEKEVVRQISQYSSSEADLITRSNIERRGREYYDKLSSKIKNLSGIKHRDSLDKLFSLWVGSDSNAPYVIERIEPLAMQKLMDFAPIFKDGIDWERTPGFEVKFSSYDQAYILTYSEDKEKEDLLAQKNDIAQNKRSPYARQLKHPKKPDVMRGDYRQFAAFWDGENSPSKTDLQTCWAHLAVEDDDNGRIENLGGDARLITQAPITSPVALSAMLARYNFDSAVSFPGDIQLQRLLLERNNQIFGHSYFLNNFFSTLSLEQLQAFGQIFNRYDIKEKIYTSKVDPEDDFANPIQEGTLSGTKRFLMLAKAVHDAFPDYFSVWKQRLLDVRDDWSEILDGEEVLSLVTCIATLNGKNPDYIDIFWKLVNSHGNAVGPMRLTEVWYGFAKLIKFVEDNKLTINKDEFLNYLANSLHGKFNATNFLYRLNFVLNHVAGHSESQEIQSKILNNISSIDWRYNGLYYACRFGKYRFWDNDLLLTNLSSLLRSPATSKVYEARWDIDLGAISDLRSYALRYLATRLPIGMSDYDLFNSKLNVYDQPIYQSIYQSVCPSTSQSVFTQGVNSKLVMRLLLASLAIGVDSVKTLDYEKIIKNIKELNNNQAYTPILKQINSLFSLDSNELVKRSYKLRFVDLPILLEVLLSIQDIVIDFKIVNIFGYALHCFDKQGGRDDANKIKSLNNLLTLILDNNKIRECSLIVYPWVVTADDNFQQQFDPYIDGDSLSKDQRLFLTQMRSVNIDLTKWFPTYSEISDAFEKMVSEDARTQTVNSWIGKGFHIIDQLTEYRRLTDEEIEEIKSHRTLKLSEAFKAFNRPLFESLVPSLAVREPYDLDEQVKPLLELLSKLDSKMEYNELGQVLGLLITKAKPQSFYSTEQLTLWLKTFLNEQEAKNKPYPTEFLKILLDDTIADERSSLLNPSLQYLGSSDRSSERLQRIVSDIIRTDLSFNSKKLLVKVAVKKKNDASVESIIRQLKMALINIDKDIRASAFSQNIVKLFDSNADNLENNLRTLINLTANPSQSSRDPILHDLLIENQAKILDKLLNDNISFELSGLFTGNNDYYIKLILGSALEEYNEVFHNAVLEKLRDWNLGEVKNLAKYYAQLPKPSTQQLANLVENPEINTAAIVIHKFETEVQATDENGQSKRIYSLGKEDLNNIQRVLGDLKIKGKGKVDDSEQKELLNLLYYTNIYSETNKLANISFTELQEKLDSELSNYKRTKKPQAMAQVQACMREILLRKTGKWVNHTQMLDLLYAALHNDESLMHQLRTGEGKSIIALMRTSYRALNGQIVDVFSSKDSLSRRDHAEFSMVLDAFKIRNSYINEKSDFRLFHHEVDASGRGAINYCTIGNFGLFISGVFWNGLANFNLKASNRAAFFDEADHILLDENTQFNYSDNSGATAAYNYDEWVYREAYEFYHEYKEGFKGYLENKPSVRRNHEIKELCERLQAKEKHVAPKESRFFKEFIIPALTLENEEALSARDQELRQLLTAAHIAAGLKEDIHYCVMEETRNICKGVDVDTSFAKVVINNQVCHGSTYSELVQQFLHVRLNHEAVLKGKTPNFFVEPNTEIALSLNAPYIVKNYYAYKEACTGTSGNKDDLKVYEEQFDISRVIKLPTHAEVKTIFEPPIYCGSEPGDGVQDALGNYTHEYIEAGQTLQVEAIVKSILSNRNQPVLITCEDDNAVRTLGEAIKARLEETPGYSLDFHLQDTNNEKKAKFILDTNNTCRSEADILPFAGRSGSVTISSRMGRGTDIKPYDKSVGLKVIRTYPTHPRVAKQEQGRQGRNGAAGVCREILNYNAIEVDFYKYSRLHQERWKQIYKNQSEHLDIKLEKHGKLKKENKVIWKELQSNEQSRKKYLRSRTLQFLKEELNREANKFVRRKEDLQALLCGHIISVLPNIREEDIDRFKEAWRYARRKINSVWNGRLANKSGGDNEEVYNAFLGNVYYIWQSFASKYDLVDPFLLLPLLSEDQFDRIEDKTLHGQNVRVIEDIKKKLDKRSIEELKNAPNIIRRMTKNYHSDKIKPDTLKNLGGITEDAAQEFYREIISLRDKIYALIEQAPQITAGVTPENPVHIPVPHAQTPTKDKTQHDDMPIDIAFYQSWFSGINQHVITQELKEGVYDELCGEDSADLKTLFETLFVASCHNDDLRSEQMDEDENKDELPVAQILSEDEQTGRREKLFSTLRDLFNEYPACYIVSAKHWSGIIKKISETTDKHLLDNYDNWLKTFFKAIADRAPKNLDSKDEAIKINRIFAMMCKIYTKVFVEKKKVSQNFTTNIVDLLLTRFKERFDDKFINNIELFFTQNPQVGELLICESNKADIARILDVVNEDDVKLGDQFTTFHEKISEELDAFGRNPECIRPMFELTVGTDIGGFTPSCKDIEDIFSKPKNTGRKLSKVKPLAKVIGEESKRKTSISSGKVFNFLSKRPGFSEDSIIAFKSILKQNPNDNFVSSLLELPPYVSLDWLNYHLQTDPSKRDTGQFAEKMAAIKSTASIFNEFLHGRGIIGTTDYFSDPKDNVLCNQWSTLFHKLSLDNGKKFFALVKNYQEISDEILLSIAEKYFEGILDYDPASSVLRVLQAIPKDYDLQDYCYQLLEKNNFENGFCTDLESNIKIIKSISSKYLTLFADQIVTVKDGAINLKDSLDAIAYFAKSIRDNEFTGFDDNDLIELNKVWVTKFNIKWLDKIISISKGLHEYESRTNDTYIRRNFNLGLRQNDDNVLNKVNLCLAIFNSMPNLPELEIQRRLFDAFRDNRIASPEILRQDLDVYQKLNNSLKPKLLQEIVRGHLSKQTLDFYDDFNAELSEYSFNGNQIELLFRILKDKSKEVRKQVLRIYNDLPNVEFADTNLANRFLTALSNNFTQDAIDKHSQFIESINKKPLSQPAIIMLYTNFLNSSQSELQKAIEITCLAEKLKQDREGKEFDKYFSSCDVGRNERIGIMRFIHLGRFDFMGQAFKSRCEQKHKELFASSTVNIPRNISSDRMTYLEKLHRWCGNIAKFMSEILEIISPRNNYQQASREIKSVIEASINKYQNYYDSFSFTTNRTRKKQATRFFCELTAVEINNKTIGSYYCSILDIIHNTQRQIVLSDYKSNTKRWFTNINSKGYSRLYDITRQIHTEVLQRFHEEVLQGKIDKSNYIEMQNKIASQVNLHAEMLEKALPDGHELKDSLKACMSHGNKIQSLKQALQTSKAVPTHLQYLLENLSTNLKLADLYIYTENQGQFDRVSMVGC